MVTATEVTLLARILLARQLPCTQLWRRKRSGFRLASVNCLIKPGAKTLRSAARRCSLLPVQRDSSQTKQANILGVLCRIEADARGTRPCFALLTKLAALRHPMPAQNPMPAQRCLVTHDMISFSAPRKTFGGVSMS